MVPGGVLPLTQLPLILIKFQICNNFFSRTLVGLAIISGASCQKYFAAQFFTAVQQGTNIRLTRYRMPQGIQLDHGYQYQNIVSCPVYHCCVVILSSIPDCNMCIKVLRTKGQRKSECQNKGLDRIKHSD